MDIYHSKNQRERKATKLQVYVKPTKPIQREHNAEVKKLAEKLRAKTLLAIHHLPTLLKQEIEKVFNECPKWTPAKRGDKNIAVTKQITSNF